MSNTERGDIGSWRDIGKGAAMMYVSTALLIVGLSQLGVIAPEPFGFSIIAASLLGATLGLVLLTGLAMVLAVVMLKYFNWRYGHRVIYTEEP